MTATALNRAVSASRSGGQIVAEAGVARRQGALARIADLRAKHEKTLIKPETDFTMATFNVQGSTHRGGGPGRTLLAAAILQSRGVDVASLQEIQGNQRGAFLSRYGGTFGMYPHGHVGEGDAQNEVVWRKSRFELVVGTTRTYHYFGGHARRMPLVKLRDKKTRAEFWVTSYHNPASGVMGYGNQAGWRSRNVYAQIRDANSLIRTGAALIIAGDMNERDSYFCKMVLNTAMHASNGGSDAGGCHPPAENTIDWILGSPNVDFSGHTRDDSASVDRATDHPLFFTQVHIVSPRISRP